jgi:hypothetical protein
MDTRIAFIADRETAIAMQSGERAFDDPAGRAEPAAMRRAPTGEDRHDALGAERLPVRLRIVPPITLEDAGFSSGAAHDGRGSQEGRRRGDRVG